MPFTSPPDYAAPNPKWSDFVGYDVVVEPVKKMLQIQTKYGNQDCWECIVWLKENEEDPSVNHDSLTPYPGVRIFSQRLLDSLDVASRTNSPLVGHVERDGNAVRVYALNEVELGNMERLYNASIKGQ